MRFNFRKTPVSRIWFDFWTHKGRWSICRYFSKLLLDKSGFYEKVDKWNLKKRWNASKQNYTIFLKLLLFIFGILLLRVAFRILLQQMFCYVLSLFQGIHLGIGSIFAVLTSRDQYFWFLLKMQNGYLTFPVIYWFVFQANARMMQVGVSWLAGEWRLASYLCATLSATVLPMIWYLPESPVFLEQKVILLKSCSKLLESCTSQNRNVKQWFFFSEKVRASREVSRENCRDLSAGIRTETPGGDGWFEENHSDDVVEKSRFEDELSCSLLDVGHTRVLGRIGNEFKQE